MDSNFQVFAGADQFETKLAATFDLSRLRGIRECQRVALLGGNCQGINRQSFQNRAVLA